MQTELAIIRQDIHAHPETSMEEERTSTFVASKLRECGLTVTEDIGRFGVVDTLTSLQPGPQMAASDRWYVTFKGTGGHGGIGPHIAADVTMLQAQFTMTLQTIISRNVKNNRYSSDQLNHEEQTKRAIKVAETVIGLANVNKNKDPQMGGEDFAFMLLKRPGAFIFMGINDEAVSVKLHSPDYNFNDDAIPFGVAYWISLVQQELNN
ncbi:unnamed protein product [Rotaria magnacalcarata]|nr:unnamed protein product [Rotaria magnacalcarata]